MILIWPPQDDMQLVVADIIFLPKSLSLGCPERRKERGFKSLRTARNLEQVSL